MLTDEDIRSNLVFYVTRFLNVVTDRQKLPHTGRSYTFHYLTCSLAAEFCDLIFTMTKLVSNNVPYITETKIVRTSI
jgi:hypothetical protein